MNMVTDTTPYYTYTTPCDTTEYYTDTTSSTGSTVPTTDTTTASTTRLTPCSTSSSNSPTTPTTITTPRPTTEGQLCQTCNAIDPYGILWTANLDETVFKNCDEGGLDAVGTASWTCGSNCKFITSQPDYSNCHSAELQSILENVWLF